MLFRFFTSGESHGKSLNVIIDGMPSGVTVANDFINSELARRQVGYGRGGRMKIEKDTAEILSGVRHGKSTGAPICLQIKNRDFENWTVAMSSSPVEQTKENQEIIESKKIKKIRPGHADLPGALKYGADDVRDILERSSARETAARVAAGAIAKCVLKEFGIEGISFVSQIGKAKLEENINPFECKEKIEASDLRMPNDEVYEAMKSEIDRAKENGDTIGGSIVCVFKNLPVGLGSHVQWDRKLDGLIAQAVMSIQAVKSVEIGLGAEVAGLCGSETHDEIFVENGEYIRKTNNSGGIEGGMTNGENVVVKAAMKAIPTMIKSLSSVEIDSKAQTKAHFERSDTCAVAACGIVVEAMIATVLADALFDKFSHDNLDDMKSNYNAYLEKISKR